jgi:hypothetical protein
MTATLLRFRRRAARPVIVSVSTHYSQRPDGAFGRDCVVRLPDGRRVVRAVSDDRLVALGLVVAA